MYKTDFLNAVCTKIQKGIKRVSEYKICPKINIDTKVCDDRNCKRVFDFSVHADFSFSVLKFLVWLFLLFAAGMAKNNAEKDRVKYKERVRGLKKDIKMIKNRDCL